MQTLFKTSLIAVAFFICKNTVFASPHLQPSILRQEAQRKGLKSLEVLNKKDQNLYLLGERLFFEKKIIWK